MPQDFDGIRITRGGALTLLPADGFAWFHLDNGPGTARPIGRLRVSYGGSAGEHEIANLLQNGQVGIGLSDPRTQLHVLGRISSGQDFVSAGAMTFFPPDGFAWFHIDNGPAGGRPIGRLRVSHGGNPGDNELMTLDQNGNVGIGTSSPTERLQVQGNLAVSGDVLLTGADCAEEFVTPSEEPIASGTVMVINEDGLLEPSARSYDTRVAGVVAGAGDQRPGIVLGAHVPAGESEPDRSLLEAAATRPQERSAGTLRRVPIGLVGRVGCLVEAESAGVRVGDLLTTSEVPGHAMRAVDGSRCFGAVLGKALRPLPEGRGIVPILVALQ
jgi:hypothetical protein